MIKKKSITAFAFLLIVTLFYSSHASAQTMPAFQMKLSNGKNFSSSELP
ncbi:MAG: hypothetical protein ABIR50_11505 [Ginsengibacter sp.]